MVVAGSSPDDPALLRVVGGVARPAALQGRDERGRFLCDAVISYSTALFTARFAVQPQGMVEMLGDEPVAGDLPGGVDAPLA